MWQECSDCICSICWYRKKHKCCEMCELNGWASPNEFVKMMK